MPATVVVNFMTVVHKASNGTSPAFPDVCKTPSPAGPIPIPYPNVAMSTDTADGSSTVKMDGNPIMLKSSNYAMSTGDEAGSAGGGVVSAKIKGKAYPQMYSFDVKADGDSVFRLLDIMLHNGGSPTNTPPATNLQPPNVVVPKVMMAKVYRIKTFKWDQTEAICGDQVSLSLTTENLDGFTIGIGINRLASTYKKIATLQAPVSGEQSNPAWLVVRGPYEDPIKMTAVATGIGRPLVASNQLTVKTIPEQHERIGPFQRLTPKFVEMDIGNGPEWIHSGTEYGWEVCYEMWIKDGCLVVWRKIDFQFKNGAHASASDKAQWKREIEAIWDYKYFFHRQKCKRGTSCSCSSWGCCKWPLRILVSWEGGQGRKVALFKGANDADGWGKVDKWWYSHTWWEGRNNVPWTVRAHEFGHQIGMYDEYPAGACDPARQYTNDPTCIMNAGTHFYARHVAEFYQWFKKKGESIVGDFYFVKY